MIFPELTERRPAATRARTRPSTSRSPTAPTCSDLRATSTARVGRGPGRSKTLYTNQWNRKRRADRRRRAPARRSTASSSPTTTRDGSARTRFGGWLDDIADRRPPAAPATRTRPTGCSPPAARTRAALLARQQHPGDRGAARLQLLDAGHQRRLARAGSTSYQRGQQRGQPARAPGVRGQPRAEPVDGRPPDVPGDAVGGRRHAADRPLATRALAFRHENEVAPPALLRRHVRERAQDRDRADRPRGDVPLHASPAPTAA